MAVVSLVAEPVAASKEAAPMVVVSAGAVKVAGWRVAGWRVAAAWVELMAVVALGVTTEVGAAETREAVEEEPRL